MALPDADTIASETESVGFEIDRLELDAAGRLELRGRWSGVRGRRFVRPTLTMRVDGVKHRLLADLEHKPWAAEEGEEWVVSFSPALGAGQADEIELAVAPDIVVSLSPPGSGTPRATAKRSANGARAQASSAPRRKPKADVAKADAAKADAAKADAAKAGAAKAGGARKSRERERAKTGDPARQPEGSEAGYARLTAERDALTTELEGLRGEQARLTERVVELERQMARSDVRANARLAEQRKMLAAERAKTRDFDRELKRAVAGSARLTAERDALSTEREGLRSAQADFVEQISELERQLSGSGDGSSAHLAEARKTLAAERAETKRLRTALEEHEPIIAERDRLARDLDAALEERNLLAAQAGELRTAQPEMPLAPRAAYKRPLSRAAANRRRGTIWTIRVSALIAMCVVLLAVAYMVRSV